MDLNISIVDAFTDEVFRGNPAAVILLKDWLSEELMQSIAMENNLSETAFLVKDRDRESYKVRWFSPLKEIDFCGHATLASACVIFEKFPCLDEISLHARSVGAIGIKKMDNGYIQMDFPNKKPILINDNPPELLDGLSIKPSKVLRNTQAYFAIYESESDVLRLEPDFELLKNLYPYDVVVTSQAKDYDFVSRYFWPANGGNEDPVTGSIHAGLAPYWSEKLGKSDLLAFQASKRGGVLLCRVTESRVYISGKATHYLKGVISI